MYKLMSFAASISRWIPLDNPETIAIAIVIIAMVV